LKLKCDEPLSNFAFNFNVRHYILAQAAKQQAGAAPAKRQKMFLPAPPALPAPPSDPNFSMPGPSSSTPTVAIQAADPPSGTSAWEEVKPAVAMATFLSRDNSDANMKCSQMNPKAAVKQLQFQGITCSCGVAAQAAANKARGRRHHSETCTYAVAYARLVKGTK
jgi:hypothetical protein